MKCIRKIIPMLLALALCLGLLPAVTLTAAADDKAPDTTTYPIWIGGEQVNENNCDKLSDNHWSYDPSTHTLTLSGYSYSGQGYVYDGSRGAAIYYNDADDLTVSLSGENHITPNGTNSGDCGIVSDNVGAALTFTGKGSMLIDSVGNFKYYSSAIYSRGTVIFSGGMFNLGNNDADYGVRVDSGSYVVIEDSISSFEAKGYMAAVNGPVRNAVAGTGYDANKTSAGRVQTSSTGAALTYNSGLQTKNYQVATFPVGEYTVVFNPGDGSGNMDPTTISEGEKLKLPKCTLTPPKDDNGNDKAFNWWEVSGADGIYYVDSEVLIANNCAWDGVVTVTAKWKAKTDSSILVDAEGQELNYTGAAQALLSQNGVAFGGTMVYAIGKDNITAPTSGWDAETPQKTDAGTYYIWYKVAGNDEHFDSAAQYTTAKIKQAAAQTIADIKSEMVYTATSVSASVAGKMPEDAGKLTYTTGDVIKTGSVTVSNFTVNSDGSVSATLSGGAEGDTVTLPVTINSTNYADSTVNVVITLTAKGDAGITISGVPAQAKTYGDADFILTGSVTDAGTGTGTWTWSTNDDTVFQITPNASSATVKILKAGTATITAKYESDTTVDTETTDTITVSKANAVPATVTANDRTYDKTEKPLVTVDESTLAGGKMQYALGTDATTAPTSGWSTSIPKATDIGTYYVWYKVEGDESHNDKEPASVEVKINTVDKTDLNKAIKAAKDYYNSIKDNNSYKEIAAALKDEITKAEAVAANDNVTLIEVVAAEKNISVANAEAAKDAAEVDKTKAEAAQQAAETAKANAEAAQQAAEDAAAQAKADKEAAEAKAAQALADKAAAEDAKDKAEAAEKAAEEAKSKAEAAQKAAEDAAAQAVADKEAAEAARDKAEAAQKAAEAAKAKAEAALKAAEEAKAKAEAAKAEAEAACKEAEERAAIAEQNVFHPLEQVQLRKFKVAGKKVTVKWIAVDGAKGYQVIIARNKKCTKKAKTYTVKGAAQVKKVIRKVKKGKYFVKVRAYKTLNGNTVYGKFSKVRKVRIK